MVKRRPRSQNEPALLSRFAARCFFAACVLVFLSTTISAAPLNEYHGRITQAVNALDALARSDDTESESAYAFRDAQTITSVRGLLPVTESIEWEGASFSVDNSWLHRELDVYAADHSAERYNVLTRLTKRLAAIEQRVGELDKPAAGTTASKEDERRKLTEILQRAEYTQKVKQESAFNRLLERILKWLANLFPKPKPMSPGRAGWLSRIAQIVVIALALGVIAFVLKLFLPRLLSTRKTKKKTKEKARIVLGERLEPDQTARDLLSDAEALARRGELRAAIRKAYIALLVEMGDRKIISLAQHKTNRDYLRAVRQVEPLYRNVKELTDSFERHWYGLSAATENDWLAFRSAYERALLR
jgi:hypothetical protein